MLKEIESLKERIKNYSLKTPADLEVFKREITGKNGIINEFFERFKQIPSEEKKIIGGALNQLKQLANEMFYLAQEQIENSRNKLDFDFTLPSKEIMAGSQHPISQVMEEVISIFERIGFVVKDGPEMEDDWHNFSALNFPDDHPARDMQDTFFVNKNEKIVLRTHTSSIQIRTLENELPPLRFIAPGRVYRCDSDATHSPVFHQIECMVIDKNVSFADLKDVLYYFVKAFFGENLQVRFRPSYFPFTEPSAEMDIGWNVDGKFKWMEILGCGMVDPNVLKNCNIDPEKYSGYAFGVGVERLAMLRYKIRDIRLFYENDVRFLKQF
ncbi:MAG: phenylalanine--tRNA ligase subunit alpha [Flavobacteriales bacterium]|nr:phenylalanine--tRNA ligase subunit alpha [Flavobacteriales bacterium]